MMSLVEQRAKQPLITSRDANGVTLSFKAHVARVRLDAATLNKGNPIANSALKELVKQCTPSMVHAHQSYGQVRLAISEHERPMWSDSLERTIRKKMGIKEDSTKFQVIWV